MYHRTRNISRLFSKKIKKIPNERNLFGAGGRGRTDTVSLPLDFESSTSANSITPANGTGNIISCKKTLDFLFFLCYNSPRAGMMELADVLDSKSSGSDTVRVRPPLPAPKKHFVRSAFFIFPLLYFLQRVHHLPKRVITNGLFRFRLL